MQVVVVVLLLVLLLMMLVVYITFLFAGSVVDVCCLRPQSLGPACKCVKHAD
jgi:hypothetical protein